MAAPAPSRRALWLCVAVVALGVGLRLGLWWTGRPLWLDETYLVENILDRSFGELLLPLGHSQSAPVLFLWAVKAVTLLAGPGELALRSFSLLCSCVQLLLFVLLLRRVAGLAGLFVGGLWVAGSYRLIYYAQELKQYSAEACVTTAIAWAAARYWEEETDSARLRWLWCIGAISILLSHTAVFPLAAFGVVECVRQGRRLLQLSNQRALWGGAIFWVPLFLANFFWVIRGNFDDPVMKRFWDFAYLGIPNSGDDLERWRTLIAECLNYFGWREELAFTAPVLAVLGLWSGVRRRSPLVLFALATTGLYILASILRVAPLFERLVVFLFPLVLLLCAAGVQYLWTSLRSKGPRVVCAAAVVAMMILWARRDMNRYLRPIEQATPAPLVAEVMRRAGPGDTIVVTPWTSSGLRYYAPSEWRALHPTIDLTGPLSWDPPKRPHRPAIPQLNVPLAVERADWSAAGQRAWLLTFKPSQRGRELAAAVGQRLGLTWSVVLESDDGGVYFLSAIPEAGLPPPAITP